MGGGKSSLICEISSRLDEDATFISVLVKREDLSTTAARDDLPFCPRFIQDLYAEGGFPADIVGLKYKTLDLTSAKSFLEVCSDIKRNYPIVVASNSKYKPLIDPQKLQEQLLGLAQVFYVDKDINSQELTKLTSPNLATWYGYVRIIEAHGTGSGVITLSVLQKQKDIERYILSLVLDKTNPIELKEHFSAEDVRLRDGWDKQRALQEKLAAGTDNSAQQKIEDLQRKLDSVAQEAREAKEREAAVQQVASEAAKILRDKEQKEAYFIRERARLEEQQKELTRKSADIAQKNEIERKLKAMQEELASANREVKLATQKQMQAQQAANDAEQKAQRLEREKEQAQELFQQSNGKLADAEEKLKSLASREAMPETCSIELGTDTDGSADGFGNRFWNALNDRLHKKSEIFGRRFAELILDSKIISICYEDSYLLKPVHFKLLYEMLFVLPGCDGDFHNLKIITAICADQNNNAPKAALHNYPNDEIRESVLRTLFPSADIFLLEKKEAPHQRALTITYEDGTCIEVILDKGLSAWLVKSYAPYIFDSFAEEQATAIRAATYSVALEAKSRGAKQTINIIKPI